MYGCVTQAARHKQGRRVWISIRRPCERSLFYYERCGHVAAEPALCRFLVNCGRSCVAGSADSLPLRCRTLPVCGSQLPRISQAELLSVIRFTLCRRTMMSFAVWRCLLMAYSSSCRFALLRLRAALFLFASVFNYREDVALLLCALHCNQQDSPDGNNSGLRVSLYLWKRTYSSLRAVKNIMFAGVFMCPRNRTEVNISPVFRGENAQIAQ